MLVLRVMVLVYCTLWERPKIVIVLVQGHSMGKIKFTQNRKMDGGWGSYNNNPPPPRNFKEDDGAS